MASAGAAGLEVKPAREALLVWGAVLGALAVLRLAGLAVPVVGSLAGPAAVVLFLWAPVRPLERRGQDVRDAGWMFERLGADLAWGLGTCAVVLPVFLLVFGAAPRWLAGLPGPVQALVAPYAGRVAAPRVDWALFSAVLGNLAVAVAEEFFYRGYVTLRLRERWPARTRVLGAVLGRADVLAAALFALGHLLTPAPWRVLTFFPALWFAWLRARTGSLWGAAVAHWLSNVVLLAVV